MSQLHGIVDEGLFLSYFVSFQYDEYWVLNKLNSFINEHIIVGKLKSNMYYRLKIE